MPQKAIADKLMDMCSQYSKQIAEQWYKSVLINPRIPAFRSNPKESSIRHAVFLYENLRKMYFADNPFQEVGRVMDAMGYAEEQFGRRVPLAEAIYALILIRRHIWLYAESSALYEQGSDMYSALHSTNRILLLFDYAIYIVTQKYENMLKK